MTDQPKQDPQEDVEAHMPLRRRDEEVPTEKPTGTEPAGDAGDDDVEGHAYRR